MLSPCNLHKSKLPTPPLATFGAQVRDPERLNLDMFIKEHLNTLKYISFLKQRGRLGASFVAVKDAGE